LTTSKVKQKRKYKVTTDSKHMLPVAENVLNRAFSPAAPNQAWGTDITYLWTQQSWIYLAVVIEAVLQQPETGMDR
jgi:transposase InsO family protein